MDNKTLESLAQMLRRQRDGYFQELTYREADLQFISENRESELEERAQEERSARLLARLDDRSRCVVEEIDLALRRIAEGSYGLCEGCRKEIPIARLRSLPATRFCLNCAKGGEKKLPMAAIEGAPHSTQLSGDLSLLSDSELEAAIREQIREDRRIDSEELKITCRRGVVYLYGVLPSETEHRILLQIVTDLVGLKEVVDRIQIEELLWERKPRAKTDRAEGLLPWDEPTGTEDVVESAEEGKDFVAPARPTPEEE